MFSIIKKLLNRAEYKKIIENIVTFIKNPGTLKVFTRYGVEIGLDGLDKLAVDPGSLISVGVKPGVVPLRSKAKTCADQWMKQNQ